MNRAEFKSFTFTRPCLSIKSCCGFMSKWTIGAADASCRACSPLAASRAMVTVFSIGKGVVLSRNTAWSKRVEWYSVTKVVLQTPSIPTTFGCPLTCVRANEMANEGQGDTAADARLRDNE